MSDLNIQPRMFRVVSGLQGQLDYVRACREDFHADKSALHKQHVVNPYWAQCAAGGELEPFAAARGFAPIMNLDALEAAIKQLERLDLQELLGASFRDVTAVLPGPATTIWLLAGDGDDEFTTGMAGGVNGTVAGTGKIWLHVLPLPGWVDRVPAAIAHEHHHSVWLGNHYEGERSQTLLNYLIMEGEACAFADTLYPAAPQPWTQALTRDQEQEVWRQMKPALEATSPEVMAAFMFGGVQGLPLFCGYTIGYRIVKAYLQSNPGVNVKGWTATDPADLLAGSGYGR